MNYYISKPSLQLSKFVKQYWAIEDCINDVQHLQRIVPHGLLELIFYFGNKPLSKDKNISISENALITGQLSNFYDIQVSRKLSIFSIMFKPHGLSMFIDIPINEFYNQSIPLKFILKKETNELENRLYEAKSFAERIMIVEHYLSKLLQKKGYKDNFDRMERSIHLINQSKGVISINFLASEACFSRKQFERTFSDYIGISPKQFLKVVRFQNAIHEKSKHENINLTNLGFMCDYYDQSHMINDFKRIAGMSPKQYFNECKPFSDYFQ